MADKTKQAACFRAISAALTTLWNTLSKYSLQVLSPSTPSLLNYSLLLQNRVAHMDFLHQNPDETVCLKCLDDQVSAKYLVNYTVARLKCLRFSPNRASKPSSPVVTPPAHVLQFTQSKAQKAEPIGSHESTTNHCRVSRLGEGSTPEGHAANFLRCGNHHKGARNRIFVDRLALHIARLQGGLGKGVSEDRQRV